ncbi:sigma-54-dependent Fis family transcriptional regulator [Pseudomonas putida]|uniref:sigma-54-dependent Fis family transcriptional regulator n=1 Tax=Pseudomonas putida TaxID=303 RepID=UPI0023658185|nr:sigma-54-dependent Fis family transcriptional regulator [Pseudomonas putida]MDD2047845.1 sigma-54-dependent Fis family transcriptional regulator [Pseudomonas putida]
MDARTPAYQQRLAIARQRFAEGDNLPANLLPDAVVDSWVRSRAAGVQPSDRWQARPDDDLQPLAGQDLQLASCVQPEIDRLWEHIGGASWALFCVNPDGVLVHARQAYDLLSPLAPLQVGRRLQEQDLGTTAPACTLAEDKPIILTGNQHYLNDFERFFCVSVPLRGLRGEVLGALDITGIGDRQAGAVLEQLNHAAMAVENRLFAGLSDCRILSLQHDPRLLGTALQGLLAVAADGSIRCANRAAQRLLGLNGYTHDHLHLEHLFDVNNLLDARPVAQQLILTDGSRLYGQLIEPTPHKPAPAPTRLTGTATAQGSDALLNQQLANAHKAFAAGVPILLLGETGTGKEVFARTLHEHWNPQAPFVAINCSAIPESLIEAELFGYAEGTFTGARKGGSSGQLAAAHGGTLLLDEIGDMPAALQTRLLRVLQEREITSLGSSVRRPLDVRVISATHCDLAQRMTSQLFREDLYYRLNGLTINLPPLRQRNDLPLLIERLRLRHGVPPLHPEVLQMLQQHTWPGNIRQLEQALRLAAALASGESMTLLCHLPVDLQASAHLAQPGDLQSTLRHTIQAALQANGGNVSVTASQLGISRTTLYKKLKD